MATVPELKAEAVRLGVKITSSMRKAEIEQAIATHLKGEAIKAEQHRRRNGSKPESVTREVSMPTATDVKALRREAARLAGSKGKSAKPMASATREQRYRWQNAPRIKGETVLSDKPLTDRQARRKLKKANRERGFNGCALATYREMRRRMKKAGIYAS